MSNNVRVVCRFRPPNQNEIDHGHKDIIEIDSEQKTVKIHHSEGNHNFTFDRTFPPGTPQKIVYDDAAKPVVEGILLFLFFLSFLNMQIFFRYYERL